MQHAGRIRLVTLRFAAEGHADLASVRRNCSMEAHVSSVDHVPAEGGGRRRTAKSNESDHKELTEAAEVFGGST
ncbi:hypothetical protein CXR25_09720 [Brevibacterium aurantiacum]|uniref:Uncharacterized protein n=1 Tax=Brevibacterium aurantiacum TaxID=273384 RepID=A0A2A3ZUZ1_BREAU|nr:hypothetical protein CXR24_09915 [Brevibacterium aurantiacum]AZL13055.1 hypothetical protein CXR25_09720 [Brevibacterium aurantiacum]AZT93545.1 hypothetical protein CXR23_10680 [Brevibacterium aurantiacum]PCC19989.1 hypothetical protein CIK79_17865 [Brevibacterium aurantiacum]PCC55328.1 hypothetical protein CIK59_00735 [Brevibacterium aurantiacum]